MNDRGSERRLERLFSRYNRLYWNGRLPHYRVVSKGLDGSYGLCEWRRRIISVDVLAHKSDRELRSTVLHEMSHAAAAMRGSRGHDPKFFSQLEMLLRKGAPLTLTINDPEAGNVRLFHNLVPSRFPLLKRKMEHVQDKRNKEIEKWAAVNGAGTCTCTITDDEIVQKFGECERYPWNLAARLISYEYGLTDECGRPVNGWARNILTRGRKVHTRARRERLAYERLRASYATLPALVP